MSNTFIVKDVGSTVISCINRTVCGHKLFRFLGFTLIWHPLVDAFYVLRNRQTLVHSASVENTKASI